MKNNGRLAGCGGVLRDDRGRFVFGYSHRLHPCTVLESELWSIFHGLRIAWSRGFTKIVIESDCSVAIDLLQQGEVMNRLHYQIRRGILELGNSEIEVCWSIIGREFNALADRLARESYEIVGNCVVYELIQDFFVQLYSVDLGGFASPSVI